MFNPFILLSKKANSSQAPPSLVGSIIFAFSIGLLAIIPFTVSFGQYWLITSSIMIMVFASSYMSGFFLGFLFGVPRYKEEINSNSNYKINNNLIEISDWLTKIIVGLGLIQLKKLPAYLTSIGFFVGEHVGVQGKQKDTMALMTDTAVIYFGVFGIYYGFNYARLVLSPGYKNVDSKLDKGVVDRLSEAINKNNDANPQTIQRLELERQVMQIESSQQSSPESETPAIFEEMLNIARQKMAAGMAINPYLPESERDPQKNQWGGSIEKDHKKLSASLSIIGENAFEVQLVVASTDSTSFPLKDGDIVLFALHNTYRNPYKIVLVKDGVAILKLIVYGSFTVGVLIRDDKGFTELEYDLTTIPNAPQAFIDA